MRPFLRKCLFGITAGEFPDQGGRDFFSLNWKLIINFLKIGLKKSIKWGILLLIMLLCHIFLQ